ncbi:MAG: molecular chaperone HtpG, partial [Candidatus Hydrogenedens sp.]|nr:molecular chaperone HtpG [Candidatus Hydrogenedens sp.]
LLEMLKGALGDRVKEVRLSSRLTESAACLVTDEGDLSPQLEKMFKAMGQAVPDVKRILELNPGHPVMAALQRLHETNPGSSVIGEYAELLYGQALIAEGGQPTDPAGFARLVAGLMVRAAG